MTFDINSSQKHDGSVDTAYTFGRPVTTYVSILQHMRLLLLKSRLQADGHLHGVADAPSVIRQC